MVTLDSIKIGAALNGIEPSVVVTVMGVVPISEGVIQLLYKIPTGEIKERLLNREDEAAISIATIERPWSFSGDGETFKLAVEAKRIGLAFLFDPMMAVHTSNVEPLPHQITAVYESMLPRQPLRFVLADDPGAGKTIMAGLYIRELIMRADARRILIVAPGSLVEQWRAEMFEKFGLDFVVFTRELELATPSGNPFEDIDHLIVRLDQMTRNSELQDKLCAAGWDLVIFDEAHKLAAHFYGSKLEKTGRFELAERLGAQTRHLLLMTATPHNGKEEDFQLFLSLLDPDRFYGKFRDKAQKVDCTDMMRRMTKEKLVKFDGTPLFPERRAYTVNYELSDLESVLYEAVTEYVKTEMGKADQIEDGKVKNSIGFALTALQRRLASSPEAIYQSLKRRHERLEQRLNEERTGKYEEFHAETVPEDDEDLTSEEQEMLEETLVDRATASRTVAELEQEINILKELEQQAKDLVASGKDRKWDELSQILQQDDPQMLDANGRMRKIIIFSEHRDTLNYLHEKIAGVLGNRESIVVIHGGVQRDQRRQIQELFRSDPEVRVLVATDAAGEGINLQNANLMVNYDLPWNPNRLEQRFGRIHRIGQREVCHLWNLVAKETREGAVYFRLLEKLRVMNEALNGEVFNVLGEVFEGNSLKDMLIEAIRYGDKPEVRARLNKSIETALDRDHLISILDREALAQETMTPERLFSVKQDMEKAEARRLQPLFIRAFFLKAFELLGGAIYPRELNRFEITHVPEELRQREHLYTGHVRRDPTPVLRRYDRVCFTKEAVQPMEKPGLAFANMIHPGHPLMLALGDVILEKHANLLRQGAVLIDPTDNGNQPSLIFLLTHEVKSGNNDVISKRLEFIRVEPNGSTTFAGWGPHLDLKPLDEADKPLLANLLTEPWLNGELDQRALAYAASKLVPAHFKEVSERRQAHVDKTLAAVHSRLTKEIEYWTDRAIKLRDKKIPEKADQLNLEKYQRTINDLGARLENRKKELQLMRHVTSATPVVLSGALVIPAGLLANLRGAETSAMLEFSNDAEARARVEKLAMDAVRTCEESRGCKVEDVSAQKCGWDLTSYPQPKGGKPPEVRHIEVKGLAQGSTTVTVTRNEILYAFNQAEKFRLAIVLVGEKNKIEGPYYIKDPFDTEPGWEVASINFDLKKLLSNAEASDGIT